VSELPVLDATDQRILGSLLEKQTTVPATLHPLTTEAWGVTRFFVRAPDGNVLTIVQQHAG
jgi:uncharacterized protein YceH (UPF0502 family)